MKRRNAECGKVRRPVKRNKITDGIYGSTLLYLKFLLLWAMVILADFILEFRFEFLWPFWMFLRSVYDSFKYQGLAFSMFFVCIALTSDMICFFFIPVHWVFFAASTYVWIQYVWHTDKGICLPTMILCSVFVYMEGGVRVRDLRHMPAHLDLCRPFAAHCIGYPVVTLGFGLKSYVGHHMRVRRKRQVARENAFYMQMLQEALPSHSQSALKDSADSKSGATIAIERVPEVTSNIPEKQHMNGNAVHIQNNSSNSTSGRNSRKSNNNNNNSPLVGDSATTQESSNSSQSNSAKASQNSVYNANHIQPYSVSSNSNSPSSISSANASSNNSKQHAHSNGSVPHGVSAQQQSDAQLTTHPPESEVVQVEKSGKASKSNSSKQDNKRESTNVQKEEGQRSRKNKNKQDKESNRDNPNKDKTESTKERDRDRGETKEAAVSQKEKDSNSSNSQRDKDNTTTSNSSQREKEKEVKEKENRETQREREKEDAQKESQKESKESKKDREKEREREKEEMQQKHLECKENYERQVRMLRAEVVQMRSQNEQLTSRLNAARAAERAAISSVERRVSEERRRAEGCRQRRVGLEGEVTTLRQQLHQARERVQRLERDLQTSEHQVSTLESKMRENGPEAWRTAYNTLRDKAQHLERSLSAETRIKMDLFSAVGEAKRLSGIREGVIRSQEKEIEELKGKIAQMLAVMPSDHFPQPPYHLPPHPSLAHPPMPSPSQGNPLSNLDPNAIAYTPKSVGQTTIKG